MTKKKDEEIRPRISSKTRKMLDEAKDYPEQTYENVIIKILTLNKDRIPKKYRKGLEATKKGKGERYYGALKEPNDEDTGEYEPTINKDGRTPLEEAAYKRQMKGQEVK